MESHQAGVNAHADGRQVEIVKQHRQVVVEAASRMEVQLQTPGGGQCQRSAAAGEAAHPPIAAAAVASVSIEAARAVLLPKPKLQLQGELGPFNGLLQVTTVNCKIEREMKKGKIKWKS